MNFTGNYNAKYDENLSYDLRGNILSLQRNTANGAGMTVIDNLTYNYNSLTNRLNTISDATANIAGFNVNGATTGYAYDLNGNYYNDPYKKIVAAKYYFNNLPKTLPVTGGGTIKLTYDASGTKLRKEVLNTSSVPILKQDYVGKIEYKDGVIEAIYTSEGRAVWVAASSSWRYEYNITDHLGNVRAVISDLNNNSVLDVGSGEIINQNAYYPFGLQMNNPALANNTTTPDTKYQYNDNRVVPLVKWKWSATKALHSKGTVQSFAQLGRLKNLGLNLMDYGARWYDPAIGRFTGVDPLSEKFPHVNPYNYAENEPVANIDLWGLQKFSAIMNNIKSWVNENLNPRNLVMGTTTEKAETLSKIHDTANQAQAITNKGYDVIDAGADCVGNTCDVVQNGALAVTASTGGLSAEVTVPIAAGAEVVGNVALGVKVATDYARDGKIDQTGSSVAIKLVSTTAGNFISSKIGSLSNLGTNSAQTKEAVKAVAAGVINTAEKIAETKTSSSSNSNSTSSSTSTYKFVVTDSSKTTRSN